MGVMGGSQRANWQDSTIGDAQEVSPGLEQLESMVLSPGARLLVKVMKCWTDSVVEGRLAMTPCLGNGHGQFQC